MNSRKPLKYLLELITHDGIETFGRHYSCYRGFVMENRDPNGMDRIFVRVPHISGRKDEGNWAYPKGKSHTDHELPKVGDMVWVEFERGDYRYPVWSFCNQTRKLGYNQPKDPESHRRITERGHTTEMNDREDYVSVNHRNGGHIRFDNEKAEVKHENGSEVTVYNDHIDIIDKSGSRITLKDGEIHLNGTNFGGLIKIEELVKRINRLETLMNTHQHAIAPNTPTIPLSPTPLIPINTKVSDLENKKVKH
jgi:hypothetical protein